MLFWDVNNGIARRAWARNKEALFTMNRGLKKSKKLNISLPAIVDDKLIEKLNF
jgi:urocanate hydratase